MQKKLWIIGCIIVLFASALNAQSIYTFQFRLQDSVTCNAFLVLQADGSGFVRYKKADALIEQQMQETLTQTVAADEEITSVLLAGKDSRLLTGSAQPFSFDVLFSINNDVLTPAAVTVSESKGKQLAGSLSNIQFIGTEQLSKELVLNYFSTNENFYQNLFINSTRALSPLEKNTRIHLIIVANTNDSTVGVAANKDMAAAEQLFADLTDVIGIKPMNIIKIYGTAYSKATLLAELKKFKPQRNDIVVF